MKTLLEILDRLFFRHLRLLLLMLTGFAFMLTGMLCGFFGFEYFALLEPRKENWIKLLSEIDPSKMWIVALLFWFCGMFTAVVPLAYWAIKYKENQQREIRERNANQTA